MRQINASLHHAIPAELQISEVASFGVRTKENPVPFKCWISGSSLQLSLPTYARLDVKNSGLGWDLLHDGSQWARYGVQGKGGFIEFTLPLLSPVRISAQGRTFVIRRAVPILPPVKFDLARITKDSGFLGFSVAVHLVLFSILILAIQSNPHIKLSDDKLAAEKAKKVVEVKPESITGAGAEAPVLRPFEGMSFTKYMQLVNAKDNEKHKVGNLLNNLTKMNLNGVKSVGLRNGLKTAGNGSNISTGVGTGNGTAMTDSIQAKKFEAAPAADGQHKLSSKEQMLIRDKLKDCHDEFRRIYNRLLTQDPHLTVTVAFEAKVLPSGYLSVAGFKSRGTYLPAALAKLQGGMADVIRNVYVGKELSGTMIRSEDFFSR